MKKTRMPQRLLSLVLVLMMLISVLPVSAMAAELTPSDPETGLTATDVTNELTDSDRLAIFEENMDSDKVSRSEIPADDEMVRVIVQLDADSLLDVRNRTNASMSMLDFQQTDAAKAQLKDIANLQLSVMNTMESKGIPSSFTFSYTSVVSGFAAQVPYGKIHDIKNISGVEDVVLCQTYYTDSMGSAPGPDRRGSGGLLQQHPVSGRGDAHRHPGHRSGCEPRGLCQRSCRAEAAEVQPQQAAVYPQRRGGRQDQRHRLQLCRPLVCPEAQLQLPGAADRGRPV